MTETIKIEELNTILPLASLEVLPAEEQKMRLQYWKEHFSIKEILEGLGTYKNKRFCCKVEKSIKEWLNKENI